MTVCKNCSSRFKGYFCNQCGQSADTHKINLHFMWHDIQHGLFHFENGVLYTAKQLYTRPGFTIKDFIEGKRVRHMKPLSMLILLATFFGFLYHSFHIESLTAELSSQADKLIDVGKINEWISSHYSWVNLISLPFYTIGSFFAFRKQGYNFMEHFVLNTFFACQRLLLRIVTFPLIYAYNGTGTLQALQGILTILEFVLTVWGYSQFFNRLSKPKAILLTVLSYAITIALTFGINALIFSTGVLDQKNKIVRQKQKISIRFQFKAYL